MSIIDAVRPAVRAMSAYQPGEQPKVKLVKLNTNENPYPPPVVVLNALREAVHGDVRRYPEPSSLPVRQAAADAYGLSPDQVLVGNGSDDILTIILRTLIDPGQVVTAPTPTYSLYRTLTQIQAGTFIDIPWPEDGALPIDALVATEARVTFVVRPNSPTGHAVPLDAVRELCRRAKGLVVLDEAYADFCPDNGIPLLAEFDNLMITRTFSKSFSLAGLRLGLGFASEALMTEMHKVRDSYNVDRFAQAAAVAALTHLGAFRPIIDKILAERSRVTDELNARGFQIQPSDANFVLARVPEGDRTGGDWMSALREQGILVRYFNREGLSDKLRITIGDRAENDALLAAVDAIL